MRVTLLCGVVAALVLAATGNAAAPTFDKAEGSGTFFGGCSPITPETCFPAQSFAFEFSAIQQGFGGRANGFFTRRQADAPVGSGFRGRVTCLNVLGNTAVLGGFVEQGSSNTVGLPFYVWVVDNGPPGSTPADFISLIWVTTTEAERAQVGAAAPRVCPQPAPSLAGYFPITSGNIVVEDESARGIAG